MASLALHAGLALTLAIGLLASVPLGAYARGGSAAGRSTYSSGESHRSSIKCESCPRVIFQGLSPSSFSLAFPHPATG